MPRISRIKGEFSTYHIIMRGNERKKIFLSDDDKERFIYTLKRMKDKYNYIVEAYCLMDNHVHLLINDNGNDISKIMKSINVSYVNYFNRKNKRTGHLFQDRFRSELIDNDNYLLAVSAYIHKNPVKAGIVKMPEKYKWSSYNYYIGNDKEKDNFVENERVLSLFSNQKKTASIDYRNYVLQFEPMYKILDIEEDMFLYLKENNTEYIDSFETAQRLVQRELELKGKTFEEMSKDKEFRLELLKKLRKNSNLSLKEIGQICGGVSQSMVCKLLKQ
ncbi:transposase [Herbivorax sp. ANBcel31]|uniref:REP-associated tyrosine transposase n=1 Tax=Herbivorax sp. ANBcel31 TaxID=3069754 RepID=UPI0027B233FF|nr:transposase [Herbivorax sp. ANBcel31]MDQ2086267.1 transposase [Herbivorax sp. ANBcel31]